LRSKAPKLQASCVLAAMFPQDCGTLEQAAKGFQEE